MTVSKEILTQLQAAFPDGAPNVINESHLHAGHAGDDGSGESHFRVELRANAVPGSTRIARHRAVHAALGSELLNRIHALAIKFSDI